MRGRHQVDVVGSPILKLQHDVGQAIGSDDIPDPQLTDGIILAEETSSRAVGKEDGSRSSRPADGRLFPTMEIPARHDGVLSRATEPPFAHQPIDPTLTGTESAIGQT